ncbi:MAG: hypothetical protein LBI28_08175 [Treponema sp.]|jgi:hypothetical protein|nr:hypothetical protein [Treponema sp.]
MKKSRKILIISVILLIFASGPVFSDTLEDLQSSVNSFSENMAKALPFHSTLGLNWSDAYIGKFTELPPHFGIGFSTGTTFMNIGSINQLTDMFDFDLPINDLPVGFPLSAWALEARIGGFFLPFDIGLKFGYMDVGTDNVLFLDKLKMHLDYMLLGADIRYALITGKTLPLKLSVGLGFNYLKGGVSAPIPAGQSFDFNDGGTNYTLKIDDPRLGLLWETSCLEFKIHASFPLVVITPYAGVGVSYAWSKTGYKIDADVTAENGGTPVSLDSVLTALRSFGITNVNENGFSQMLEVEGLNVRAFGGFSVNMTVIKLDITGMYNFLDSSWGFSMGARLQI